MFEGSLKGVSRNFQGLFKENGRVFWERFKGVSREFQGYISKMPRILKSASKNFLGYFKSVLMKFKGYSICFKKFKD